MNETIVQNPQEIKLSDVMARTPDIVKTFNFDSVISDENEQDYPVNVVATVSKDILGFHKVSDMKVYKKVGFMLIPQELLNEKNLNNLSYEAIMNSIDMPQGMCLTGTIKTY